jgi:putative DNA primase/helicase
MDIHDLVFPPVPAWILNKIKRLKGESFELPDQIFEGQRNHTLFRYGRWLHFRNYSEAELRPILHAVNQANCIPPLPQEDVEKLVHNAATLANDPEFTAQYNGAGPKHETASRATDEWPDPEPWSDVLRPVKSITPEMLPAVFEAWLCDISDRYQAPLEYVAVPAIIAAGALIGRKLTIRPERFGDWCEVANLWGVIVGRPGVMKSPMMGEALKPIYRFDREAYQRFTDSKRDNDFKRKYATLRREAIEAELKRSARDEKQSEALREQWVEADYQEPLPQRYLVNDATVEKLGELLNQNPNGLLEVRDELGALLARLENEDHANERGFFLSAWAGKTSHHYDRIGRGTVRIDAACLSVIGAITPNRLDGYMRETFGGGNDDGLMQRFGLAVYPDLPAPWKHVDRAPDIEAFERAFRAYRWLDAMQPDQVSAHVPDYDLPYLRLNDDALAVFEPWRAKLELILRTSDEHPALLSHLAKYRTLVPALTLVFRLLDMADGKDDGASWELAAKKALAWAEVFESHARRIYQGVITPAETAAALLAAKLRKSELPNPFRVRDVYRKCWTGLSRRPDIELAVEELEDAGWVRRNDQRSTKPGRPSLVFQINPKVLR